jgi:hypothetical protein
VDAEACGADRVGWAVPGVDRPAPDPEPQPSAVAGAALGAGVPPQRAGAAGSDPDSVSSDEPVPGCAAGSTFALASDSTAASSAATEDASDPAETDTMPASETSGGGDLRGELGAVAGAVAGAGGHVHPVVAAVATCLEALDGVREAGVGTLSAREVRLMLLAVVQVITAAFALKLRLVVAGEAQRVADLTGAASTAAFLGHLTQTRREDAAAEVRLAHDLQGRFGLLGEAVARGAVSPEQVRVCVAALRRLPRDLDPEQSTACQRFLLEAAQTMTPRQLKVLGRRLWEVVDPDGAEAKQGKDLRDEEELARAKAYFKSWRNGDGTTGFRGRLPDLHADMLLKLIRGYAAPRRHKNPNIPTSQPDDTRHPTTPDGEPTPEATDQVSDDPGEGPHDEPGERNAQGPQGPREGNAQGPAQGPGEGPGEGTAEGPGEGPGERPGEDTDEPAAGQSDARSNHRADALGDDPGDALGGDPGAADPPDPPGAGSSQPGAPPGPRADQPQHDHEDDREDNHEDTRDDRDEPSDRDQPSGRDDQGGWDGRDAQDPVDLGESPEERPRPGRRSPTRYGWATR